MKLLAADLVGEDVVLESLRTLRADLDALEAQTDENADAAELLPHRRTYLLLNIDLVRRLIAAHREWLDEVERALQPDGGEESA